MFCWDQLIFPFGRQRAGRQGCLATVRKYRRCYMSEIGRRGAAVLYERYRHIPYGVSGWALIDRETEQVKARW